MSDQIRELLEAINSSWLSTKPEELPKILGDCTNGLAIWRAMLTDRRINLLTLPAPAQEW